METESLKGKSWNNEHPYNGVIFNGFLTIVLVLVLLGAAAMLIFTKTPVGLVFAAILAIVAIWMFSGFIMLEPNQAVVLTFFGKYKGTFAQAGYY